MGPQLEQMLRYKRKEADNLKARGFPKPAPRNGIPVRNFKAAISKPYGINLIAEIKFASPSAGTIRKGDNVGHIARMYEQAGAAAISLVTDKRYFKGDIQNLPLLKRMVSLPILRKDFIMEEIQVKESRIWGADAILLIARIVSVEKLKRLLSACRRRGVAALTEVHDRADLEKAVASGAPIIGINNRNLDTFEVDLDTTLTLAPRLPQGVIRVSESGIHSRGDVKMLKKAGIHAVLVGTALMKSAQIAEKVKELTGINVP
ncbi:MAG: indole-3-glycerol phosphate synthase TrpC [Desulfobacteraceae bacterium]